MKVFKLSTVLALSCAIVLFSAPVTADAKKFAPTSFVRSSQTKNRVGNLAPVQKTHFNLTTLPHQKNVLSAKGGSSVGEPYARAGVSKCLDYIFLAILLAFGYFWIKSLEAEKFTPAQFPFFEKSVLENGFCNKAFKIGPPARTQKICFFTDMVMVAGSYFVAKSKGVNPLENTVYLGGAIYTIIHGFVHNSVFSNPDISTGPVDPLSLGILAIILIFCPVGLFGVLKQAPQTKDTNMILPISGAVWIGCVALFGKVFKQKQYALTFINLSIFFFLYLAKVLLLRNKNPEQIAARESFDKASYPHFWLAQAATALVFFIMCSEPVFCVGWFGELGGHVLFDIALYTYLMVTSGIF